MAKNVLGSVLILAVVFVSAAPVAAGYEVVAVTDGGTIEGKVVFSGQVPPPRKIIPTKDREVCGGPREAPQIVLAPDQGVAEAVVFLRKVDRGKAWEKPSAPELANSNCDFTPHVQIVPLGTEMDFSNADPVFHNLHTFLGKNTVHNVSLPKGGRKIKRPFEEAGMVRAECDAHAWMLAWIFVADNPYYALTGKDGRFVIKDIPPGTYTLSSWQAYTGFKDIPVAVKAKAATPITITVSK